MKVFVILAIFIASASFASADTCKKEQAKDAVEKACTLINAKKDAALPELNTFRFCEDNYIGLIKGLNGKVIMLQHPIKPRINGQDVTDQKDENGKALFVEFVKAAGNKKEGTWVDYMWAKPGAERSTAKTSFVKACGDIIAIAGVWK